MGLTSQMNKTIFIFVEEDSKVLQKKLHECVLSYYLVLYCVNDNDIRIEKEPGGKPYVSIGNQVARLKFNISHTSGIGVVAFSECSIGVDIEKIHEPDYRIVRRFFIEPEQRYILDGESEEIRRNRFFEIWTKKEAYLKWKGCGLAGELKNINVLEKRYAYQQIEIGGSRYAMSIYNGII